MDRNGIRFRPYIIGEDFLFISTALLANPKVISTSTRIYRYVIRKGSASTTRGVAHTRRCVADHIEVIRVLEEKIYQKALDKRLKQICLETFQDKMLLIFSRILSANYTLRDYKKVIKECAALELVPLKITACSLKRKICYDVINLLVAFPVLYKPMSLAYVKIFVPYILASLNRNK